jgi:hypothetical protein
MKEEDIEMKVLRLIQSELSACVRVRVWGSVCVRVRACASVYVKSQRAISSLDSSYCLFWPRVRACSERSAIG